MLKELPSGFLGQDGQFTSTEVGVPFSDIKSLNWSLQLQPGGALLPAEEIFQSIDIRPSEKSPRLYLHNEPVTQIRVFRSTNQDLLTVASSLQSWLAYAKERWPDR